MGQCTDVDALKCNDDWLNSLDAKNYNRVVFVDLKKHLVDNDILLEKLALHGIQGHALTWLKSYLSNHTQFTRINGYDSNIQSTRFGAPQGSCLGSLLFPYISITSQIP